MVRITGAMHTEPCGHSHLHLSTEHLPLQLPPCLLFCCGLGLQAFPWVTQDNRVTPWEADVAADRHFLFFLSAR